MRNIVLSLIALLSVANVHLTLDRWPSTKALSGTVPNARLYLLRVTGKPGESVLLRATGLPREWIASFCTPRVCAPFRVSFQMPRKGELDTELQIIPPDRDKNVKARFTIAALAADARATLVGSTSPKDAR